MRIMLSQTLFIALLLTLNACNQTHKSVTTIEEAYETPLFTSTDLRNAILVKDLGTKELHSLDLNNDETGAELSSFDKDEKISELDTQGVIAGARGWLALYRVRDSDGLNQIRLYDQSNNTNRVTVYSGTDKVESVAVSEDGKTVVAAIKNPVDNKNDVYLFDLNVTPKEMYQLTTTTTKGERNVSITADGLKIAYERKKSGLQTPFICTYNPNTNSCSNTTIIHTLDQIQPSISANGKYLALVRLLSNGKHRVGIYDLMASPNPTYTTIKTRTDVLAHPSVNDLGTIVAYLWERSSNNTDYLRIKDLTGPSFSTELSSTEGLDHTFITRYANYTTYQQFLASKSKYQVRTREISSDIVKNPQGKAWEYFRPFWMTPTCGVGTTVVRNPTLKTQADVDALEGVSTIEGFLHIDPTNTSLDLSPLYLLTEVTGTLQLSGNSIQTTFSDFKCLTKIRGSLNIANNANLSSISDFLRLTSVVGAFNIANNANLSSIGDFPLLASVGNDFFIFDNTNLSSIGDFPVLASVEGFAVSDSLLSSLPSFPLLTNVGGFQIIGNANLSSISGFPLLASVGGFF